MADYILKHSRPLDAAHVPDELKDDKGTPMFEANLHYDKTARRRGLYLSIARYVDTTFGKTYMLMSGYNGLIFIAELARKPSPKVAALWEARVTAQLDAIAQISLASEKPNWSEIQRLFLTVDA
jgi:hypothetical protein